MITCTKCGKEKPDSDYYRKSKHCKECKRQYQRDYRKNNPEIVKAQQKRSSKRRRGERNRQSNLRAKEKYSALPETWKRYRLMHTLSNSRRRARKKGIENNLDLDFLLSILPTKCPLLERELTFGSKDDYAYSPSIDRIDNSKGYTKDNVWIISTKANTMKSNASLEDLKLFAKNVLKI